MKKTKEEAGKTKEQLLESALELFLKQGYSKVSLHQIADFMGLTRGAFYWHFKSKEEILNALVAKEQAFIENLMVNLFTSHHTSPVKHLKFVLNSIVSNFFNNKRFKDFIELTWFKIESDNYNVNFPKSIANEFFLDEIEKIVHQGMLMKIFDNGEEKVWAAMIAANINGIYRLHFISPHYMQKKMALKIVDCTIKSLLRSNH